MKRKILNISLTLLFCFPLYIMGNIRVVGWVIDERNNPLRDAVINLYEGSRKVEDMGVNRRGRFITHLDMNKSYIIEITAPQMIGKKFAFDTRLPSDARDERGLGFELVVDLFEGFPGAEPEVFSKPLLNFFYDPAFGNFYFNEQQYIEITIKVEEARDYIEELYDKKEIYEGLIETADMYYESGNLEGAYDFYSRAVDLNMPGDYALNQKNIVGRKLGIPTAEDLKYNEMITNADNRVEENELEKAIQFYKDALKIKPDENYPGERIRYCEDLLAAKRKAEEKPVIIKEEIIADEPEPALTASITEPVIIPQTPVVAEQPAREPVARQDTRSIIAEKPEVSKPVIKEVGRRIESQQEKKSEKPAITERTTPEHRVPVSRKFRQISESDFEKVRLTAEHIEQIKANAEILKQNPNKNLIIHSNFYSGEYNTESDFYLSKYQASAVIGYLAGMGIDINRLYPVFYSDNASNITQKSENVWFEFKSGNDFKQLVNNSHHQSIRYLDDLRTKAGFNPQVEFLVQFTAVDEPVEPSYYERILENMPDNNIYYYFSDKWLHHYAVGNIDDLSEALDVHRKLRNLGYDTYIITLFNGKRIFTTEIRELAGNR